MPVYNSNATAMWISVPYHKPNQWIVEWGVQNACHAVTSYRQVMPSALSTTHVHSPLSSNRGCWAYLSCDQGPTSPPTGPRRTVHHALMILISSDSALSSVQRPVPLLLRCGEWPLWLAVSLPVWPCTLQADWLC